MIAARSRHAQYSSVAPWLSKLVGSQYPLYSVVRLVSSEIRGWKPVSVVRVGSASGVTRCAIAAENVCSGE